jgi:hypothetical protein
MRVITGVCYFNVVLLSDPKSTVSEQNPFPTFLLYLTHPTCKQFFLALPLKFIPKFKDISHPMLLHQYFLPKRINLP